MTEWLIVLPETRQVLQQHYPAAFQNPAYLRLLGHLLFSADSAEGQPGQVLLNQSVLAWAERKEAQVQARNYQGEAFLHSYFTDVHGRQPASLGFRSGVVRAWQPEGPPEVSAALKKELTTSRRERERRGVRLQSGRRVNSQSGDEGGRRNRVRRQQASAISLATGPAEPVRVALHVLNTQATRALRRVVRASLDRAREGVLGQKHWTSEQQRAHLRRLLAMEQQEVPLYGRAKLGASQLVETRGWIFHDLHPAVERHLYSGLMRWPLPSSWMLTATWTDPELREWLEAVGSGGRRPVDALLHEAKLLHEIDVGPHWPLLNRAFRELLLGASDRRVMSLLTGGTRSLAGVNPVFAQLLLKSAPVRRVIKARERQAARLRAQGITEWRETLLRQEWQWRGAAFELIRGWPAGEVGVLLGHDNDLYLWFRNWSRVRARLRQLRAATQAELPSGMPPAWQWRED